MSGIEYSNNPSKRQQTNLLSTFRARNGGSDTSFLPGLTDTIVSGSDTEEEDNKGLAQEYLNKMSDDTERPTQTVFGKGVNVWKSQDGTIYADINDRMKKKQRDEDLWGKKRKRDAQINAQGNREQCFDSLRNSHGSPNPLQDNTPNPSSLNGAESCLDGKINYPSLPSCSYPSFVPPTPTASEWELFPISGSFSQSILSPATLPPPIEYRPLKDGDTLSDYNRPTKPLPARARGAQNLPTLPTSSTSENLHTTSTHTVSPGPRHPGDLQPPPHSALPAAQQPTRQLPSISPFPTAPPSAAAPATTGVLTNVFGAACSIVLDSFGGIGSTRDVDRFDERPYRLGQAGDRVGGTKEEGGGDGGAKLDPFKGRPWLRKG